MTTKLLTLTFLLFFIFSFSYSQVKKVPVKPPKFTLSFALSYNYAAARAYGSVYGFSVKYDSSTRGYFFNGQNYGMLQGGGIMNIGKLALDKKRRLRATYNIGYNLFYNYSQDNSNINTKWHLFNGALGLEYSFSPKSKFKSYVGFEFLYTLLFGSWNTDYTDSTGATKNIYVKFNTAHRLGAALNSGIEFKIKKRTGLLLGYRLIWANILPKQNKFSSSVTDAYINDSKNDNGVDIGFSKQIVYLQLIAGVNIYFYK